MNNFVDSRSHHHHYLELQDKYYYASGLASKRSSVMFVCANWVEFCCPLCFAHESTHRIPLQAHSWSCGCYRSSVMHYHIRSTWNSWPLSFSSRCTLPSAERIYKVGRYGQHTKYRLTVQTFFSIILIRQQKTARSLLFTVRFCIFQCLQLKLSKFTTRFIIPYHRFVCWPGHHYARILLC